VPGYKPNIFNLIRNKKRQWSLKTCKNARTRYT